ncbi:hypothetical protein GGI35DRAFT_148900 [Trichoderma velutinum]
MIVRGRPATTCHDLPRRRVCRSEASSSPYIRHACTSVCKPAELSLIHIRHKQRKCRDTRLITCRAQLPLRSCHWKPGSTADLSLTIMTHHHMAVTQLHLFPLAALRGCSRQHRYYQRYGHVYSKEQVIPKQPVGAKKNGANHELEIWPLNFRWCWPVWWWYFILSSTNQLGVSEHTCCHPCICEAVGLCPDRVVRPFIPYV